MARTSPKSGFLRYCEQSVDFPVPQDVGPSIVLAVFFFSNTGDVGRSASIHDEDQSDVDPIS